MVGVVEKKMVEVEEVVLVVQVGLLPEDHPERPMRSKWGEVEENHLRLLEKCLRLIRILETAMSKKGSIRASWRKRRSLTQIEQIRSLLLLGLAKPLRPRTVSKG